MKKFILLTLTIIFTHNFYAQDIHFSQYMQAPSLVNPALTGIDKGVRASLIYKDQWRSVTVPYKTFGASFEMRFKPGNWAKFDPFKTKTYKKSESKTAAGLAFFRDRAGDGNMGITEVDLSFSTTVTTSKFSFLSVGLQAGIVQKTIDFSKLLFPSQYNAGNYDPTINSGENYASQNFIYPDFAGGINWHYDVGDDKSMSKNNNEKKGNIGLSVYHINQPKQKYLATSNPRLTPKFVFYADAVYGINDTKIAFAPSYMVEFQGRSLEMVEGLMVKYYFKENSKYTGIKKKSNVGVGLSYRNNDAIILTGLLEYQNYAIGVSYDLNMSKLTSATTGRGGPEVFIRFVNPGAYLYQMKD